MSRNVGLVWTFGAHARGNLRGGLFALALLVAPALGVADSASAQSSYGTSSYGVETYSADDRETSGVRPPNTGFEVVSRVANEAPALFWGSIAALVAALASGVVVVRRTRKRKQEK